jgi:hypothetical protein
MGEMVTTEKRSAHDLKVGEIVQDRGARMAVIEVKDGDDYAGRTKTLITWVELVADGEVPKTHRGTEPDAIGVHKTDDHTFDVEIS